MTYRARILELMRDCECDTVTPAAVEAWMRMAHPTLDALSADEFRDAADNAMVEACMAGDEFNARLVRDMGV